MGFCRDAAKFPRFKNKSLNFLIFSRFRKSRTLCVRQNCCCTTVIGFNGTKWLRLGLSICSSDLGFISSTLSDCLLNFVSFFISSDLDVLSFVFGGFDGVFCKFFLPLPPITPRHSSFPQWQV